MDELFTAEVVIDAVGKPGSRIFVVQIEHEGTRMALKAEKEQAAMLAQQLLLLLDKISEERGPDTIEPPAEIRLRPPADVRFAIGTIAYDYDADRDLVAIEFQERVSSDDAEDGDEEDDAEGDEAGASGEAQAVYDEDLPEPEGDAVRVWLTRTKARSLATHALEVVGRGRPACELCGQPKGPDHICPRSNGKLH